MPVKRNVNIVVETGSLAGGVRVIGELANRLAMRDWTVAIWSVNPKETLTKWFRLDARVKWHSFLKDGLLSDYHQLIDVLGKQDGIKMGTFWRTALAVADSSKPGEGYYLVQDIETSYVSQSIMAGIVMQTYGLGLHMLTTSRWVQSTLPVAYQEVFKGQAIPVPDYIGLGLENKYRPNHKLARERFVLACARVQALKGWDRLCETFRYLSAAGAQLKTFGLDKKIPMIAQTDHISFPSDDKIRQLYQQAGVFLSPSLHEGFNLTALEAMASGCPVVTSDSEGNREYIQPGENCLMSNDPFELAGMCAQVVSDRDLAKKLSENGPKTALRYRWADVLDRTERYLLD